ncbi:MAG: efflux RND transporter periplasmic adaptor subunit [Cyanobacteria bacterium J06642_3]
MKPIKFINSVLAAILVASAPSVVLSHAGHGDEFQSEGGIERVKVKTETDQILGIVVEPIAPNPNGGSTVMVPATALIDADGQQLVFVKHGDFYEPVPVTTGTTQGELIEVTQGLTVGEKLVTQGSLALYAESRKKQSSTKPATNSSVDDAHAKADAQGIPHSHDDHGNFVESKLPVGRLLAAIGGGALLLIGGASAISAGQDKDAKEFYSEEEVPEKENV